MKILTLLCGLWVSALFIQGCGFRDGNNDVRAAEVIVNSESPPPTPPTTNVVRDKGKSKAEKLPDTSKDDLITLDSIGKIRTGMTEDDIKKAYPNSVIGSTDDPTLCGQRSVSSVAENGKSLFYFYLDPVDPDSDKIVGFMTDNSRFVTERGIRVGDTYGDAEKAYGKPQFERGECYDFVVFFNVDGSNKSLSFYSYGSPKKNYTRNRRITHIQIGGDE